MHSIETNMNYEGSDKQTCWARFEATVNNLQKRRDKDLRILSEIELMDFFNQYQTITADLARARSLGAPDSVVDRLNRMAVAGHMILYAYNTKPKPKSSTRWWASFAQVLRQNLWALGLSSILFFGAALITFVAVIQNPPLGFDLVPDEFLHFNPAKEDNMHDIPSLSRPIAASSIMSNNIQVSLLAFGFGLTAGIGTSAILLFNGMYLGAIAGWFSVQGNSRALWGWVMPHGGVELLAICIAGAGGFLLAKAIYCPGQVSRRTALKKIGKSALTMEVGVIVMLVFAGLIEGFVSPSSITYPTRIAVLISTLGLWGCYFAMAGNQVFSRRH
ncbi:MAG TPA: hypothetical protein DCR17_04320 [Verrucomicrobiales bacterium]|nr:hypothetical protein [Verrucomicrobiales bacterium]HCZ02098.1 hypothetical protein [Verrucomicrobiales bacterium]